MEETPAKVRKELESSVLCQPGNFFYGANPWHLTLDQRDSIVNAYQILLGPEARRVEAGGDQWIAQTESTRFIIKILPCLNKPHVGSIFDAVLSFVVLDVHQLEGENHFADKTRSVLENIGHLLCSPELAKQMDGYIEDELLDIFERLIGFLAHKDYSVVSLSIKVLDHFFKEGILNANFLSRLRDCVKDEDVNPQLLDYVCQVYVKHADEADFKENAAFIVDKMFGRLSEALGELEELGFVQSVDMGCVYETLKSLFLDNGIGVEALGGNPEEKLARFKTEEMRLVGADILVGIESCLLVVASVFDIEIQQALMQELIQMIPNLQDEENETLITYVCDVVARLADKVELEFYQEHVAPFLLAAHESPGEMVRLQVSKTILYDKCSGAQIESAVRMLTEQLSVCGDAIAAWAMEDLNFLAKNYLSMEQVNFVVERLLDQVPKNSQRQHGDFDVVKYLLDISETFPVLRQAVIHRIMGHLKMGVCSIMCFPQEIIVAINSCRAQLKELAEFVTEQVDGGSDITALRLSQLCVSQFNPDFHQKLINKIVVEMSEGKSEGWHLELLFSVLDCSEIPDAFLIDLMEDYSERFLKINDPWYFKLATKALFQLLGKINNEEQRLVWLERFSSVLAERLPSVGSKKMRNAVYYYLLQVVRQFEQFNQAGLANEAVMLLINQIANVDFEIRDLFFKRVVSQPSILSQAHYEQLCGLGNQGLLDVMTLRFIAAQQISYHAGPEPEAPRQPLPPAVFQQAFLPELESQLEQFAIEPPSSPPPSPVGALVP